MNQYLTQSDKLTISGILAGGDDAACDSLPPLEESAPRFPYSAIRDKVNGYAPPAPRNYAPCMEDEETPDIGEDEESDELDSLLRSFSREKQGREVSPDILPSMRHRGAIRAELSSMGVAWGE